MTALLNTPLPPEKGKKKQRRGNAPMTPVGSYARGNAAVKALLKRSKRKAR